MSDAGILLQQAMTLLGVGGGCGIAIIVLAYVVKASIAKAVEQAGQAELVKLKSQLDESIEKSRQSFTERIEAEKQAATKSIEVLKTALSTQGEVRKQVAAKRVESALAIARKGRQIRVSIETGKAKVGDVQDLVALVTDDAFLFSKKTVDQLYGKSSTLASAVMQIAVNRGADVPSNFAGLSIVNEIMDLVRGQLFVDDD